MMFMLKEENLKVTSDLFNRGLLKIQDAIAFGLNGYILNCEDGKVTNIMYEPKED